MQQEVIVIRHGEADHQIKGLLGGKSDSELTEIGRKQAYQTADFLKRIDLISEFNVYTSPLQRSRQTSEIICSALGKKCHIDENISDMDYGTANGLPMSELEKIQYKITEPILDWVPFEGAESWNMMKMRVNRFMTELSKMKKAIIITHVNPAIEIIGTWMGINEIDERRVSFDIDNCSISHLYINKWNERTFKCLNEKSHLDR